MARILYIGDAVTATGYRLAGAETRVPPEGEVAGTIREAVRGEVDLVLLSPAVAQSLPGGRCGRSGGIYSFVVRIGVGIAQL